MTILVSIPLTAPPLEWTAGLPAGARFIGVTESYRNVRAWWTADADAPPVMHRFIAATPGTPFDLPVNAAALGSVVDERGKLFWFWDYGVIQ